MHYPDGVSDPEKAESIDPRGDLAWGTIPGLVAAAAERFGAAKADLPRVCRDCPVRFVCNGDCPKHRFVATGDGEPGLSYLCPSYLKFFKHIGPAMEQMADLLRAGRAPAEIMKKP